MNGISDEMDSYQRSTLPSKLETEFRNQINISKFSNKVSNYIYPIEYVRSAAMTLRSEMLRMSKTKVPTPTSIDTLKSTSPVIPHFQICFSDSFMWFTI